MYEGNHLAQRLRQASAHRGAETFINDNRRGVRITYDEFFANAERLANTLVAHGVKTDERVLIHAEKSVASLELYVACLLAGAIYVPINPALPVEDLGYFLDDAQPAVVVFRPDTIAAIQAICSGYGIKALLTLSHDETGTLISARDDCAEGFRAVKRESQDIAAILYTSGTTGQPKGVVHTHRSLASNAEVLTQYWHFSEKDALIHALPIFHLHGLFTAINVTLFSGGSCIYLQKFDPGEVLRVMPTATVMMGVPPFYMTLLQYPELAEAAEGIRLFISGSAPMLTQTHARWHEVTGHTVLERYGMTECSMIASNPYEGVRKPNSVGYPLPGIVVRIVAPDSEKLVAVGEIGRIQIRGENLFSSYWRKPQKTAEDMTNDGFFNSGDFGKYDADGYLYVIGRAKDAINTSQGLIFPKEIEEKIDLVEGVAESAIVAAPHPELRQAAVAVIVLKTDAAVSETAVLSAIGPTLKKHQLPCAIRFVDALPRNVMGKVEKTTLREMVADEFSPSSKGGLRL